MQLVRGYVVVATSARATILYGYSPDEVDRCCNLVLNNLKPFSRIKDAEVAMRQFYKGSDISVRGVARIRINIAENETEMMRLCHAHNLIVIAHTDTGTRLYGPNTPSSSFATNCLALELNGLRCYTSSIDARAASMRFRRHSKIPAQIASFYLKLLTL